MALLRANSRPRASADLGYRILAGVVAGGFVELLGVNLARDRNPDRPDYLVPSLVAAGIGVAVAILDPPDDPEERARWAYLSGEGSGSQGYSLRSAGGRRQSQYRLSGMYPGRGIDKALIPVETYVRKSDAIRRAKELARQYNTSVSIDMRDEYGYHDWTVEPSGNVVEM